MSTLRSDKIYLTPLVNLVRSPVNTKQKSTTQNLQNRNAASMLLMKFNSKETFNLKETFAVYLRLLITTNVKFSII